MAPSSGFAGDHVTLQGERLGGASVGVPTVLFGGAVGVRVLESEPGRVVVEVPLGAGEGPVSVRTPFGEASSPGDFGYLGPGKLPAEARVARASVALPLTPAGLALDDVHDRALVRLEQLNLAALVGRADGQVTFLAAPSLLDVGAGPGGALWMLESLDGVVPIGADGGPGAALPLPGGVAVRLGVSADGTWACIAYSQPRSVGLVDLRTGATSALTAPPHPVVLAQEIIALTGPPRGCLEVEQSTYDPEVAFATEYRETAGRLVAAHAFRLDGVVQSAAVTEDEADAYVTIISPRRVAHLVFATGASSTVDLPGLPPRGIVLSPGGLFIATPLVRQVIELSRPSLAPLRALTIGGYPAEVRSGSGRLVVADQRPPGLLYADATSGLLLGERRIDVRAHSLAAFGEGPAFVLAPGGAATLIYVSDADRFLLEAVDEFPGQVLRLAASTPDVVYVAASVEEADGPHLIISRREVPPDHPAPAAFLDAPLPGPLTGLAATACYGPWPCPFGSSGAVIGTVKSSDALVVATGDGVATAMDGTAWLTLAQPGLTGPGALALSPDEPAAAVGEALPALAFVDLSGSPTVTAHVPLEVEPAAVAWIRGTRSALVLGDGRLWRVDAAAGAAEISLPWSVESLAVSPDGREAYLATSAHARVLALELSTGRWHLFAAPAGVAALSITASGATLGGLRADNGQFFSIE